MSPAVAILIGVGATLLVASLFSIAAAIIIAAIIRHGRPVPQPALCASCQNHGCTGHHGCAQPLVFPAPAPHVHSDLQGRIDGLRGTVGRINDEVVDIHETQQLHADSIGALAASVEGHDSQFAQIRRELDRVNLFVAREGGSFSWIAVGIGAAIGLVLMILLHIFVDGGSVTVNEGGMSYALSQVWDEPWFVGISLLFGTAFGGILGCLATFFGSHNRRSEV